MIIDPYTWSRHQIETITRVTNDTVAVGFKRPTSYHFRAGQYAVVRATMPNGTQLIRQYSFSSAPDDESLELLIQKEPEGIVSSWFFETAVYGDEVELSQPLGNFTLEKTDSRPLLLIAGRIGVAPFISMMRDKKRRKLSVLYSVRNADQVCFPELLEQFRATIIQTDTSPRISAKFLEKLVQDNSTVYICGSKQFVDSMSFLLTGLNISPNDIKRELFTLQ